MNKRNMNLDKQNLPDNFLEITEEQKERIEKLDKLNSCLYDLKVTLKREDLLRSAFDVGLDVDKFINRTNRRMRSIATSEQHYVQSKYKIEVSD